jgi:predicted phage terminase large subunit-like protein
MTPEIVEGVVKAFLIRGFDNPSGIPECHREWWDMVCTKHKFVALAAPRGHAKSTAITHSYVISNLVFRECKFVLIVADTETQASMFLEDIKKELSHNEDLMKTFGIKGFIKDSVTDFIMEFHDGTQFRVMAKGAGQSMRGVKWDNKRPDLIMCDDLENEEMVLNKERRSNFRRWFSGTLIPALSKDGIIRVVGTILHTDSQLNRLMPRLNRKDRPCLVTDLKEVANPKDVWFSARYRAHDKRMEVALWPEYKPISWLMEQRQEKLDQGLADLWAQEMLNVPFDEANAPFKIKDFHPMAEHDWDQNMNYYISCDFATSDKQKSDYTAFLVSGISSDGTINVVKAIKDRLESPEILETLKMLVQKYDPRMVFVEAGQIWNTLEPLVTNEMYKTGDFYLIEKLPSITDKRSRSASIRARMRAGAVKFDTTADWYPDFLEECLRFTGTGSTHDDQVDTLSLLGLALNKFVDAPTREEDLEEQYEDEKRESGMYEIGRSEIGGY